MGCNTASLSNLGELMKLATILFNKTVKLFAGKKFTKNKIIAKTFYYGKSWLKEKSITIDGSIIYLDKFDSLCLSINKSYEKEETELIRQHVKKSDVILDIGANIGYYTILFSKLGKEVHAFEPDETNFSILQKNIKANNLTNVISNKKAVSNKNGTINLSLNKLNTGGHYITNKETGVKVETIILDDYIKSVDFVKMDVEGAETLALMGMKNLLANPNLKLLIEYNPNAIANFGFNDLAFLFMLRKHFTLMDVKDKTIIEDMESFAAKRKITNLFCYK